MTTFLPESAKAFTASIASGYATLPLCRTPNWSNRIPCNHSGTSQLLAKTDFSHGISALTSGHTTHKEDTFQWYRERHAKMQLVSFIENLMTDCTLNLLEDYCSHRKWYIFAKYQDHSVVSLPVTLIAVAILCCFRVTSEVCGCLYVITFAVLARHSSLGRRWLALYFSGISLTLAMCCIEVAWTTTVFDCLFWCLNPGCLPVNGLQLCLRTFWAFWSLWPASWVCITGQNKSVKLLMT